jgi:hypothetical protein
VDYKLQGFKDQVNHYEQMQRTFGGLGFKQAFASFRLTQLGPKVLWWHEMKTAIESNEPERAMSALERLIKHYRSSNFVILWLWPFSSNAGFALLVAALVKRDICEAKTLRDHFYQMSAQ